MSAWRTQIIKREGSFMLDKKNGLLELIFDLACAFTLLRASVLLAEPSDGIIAPAAIGLFILMAAAVLGAWSAQVLFTDRCGSGQILDRIFTLAQLPLILIAAESIRSSWSSSFVLFMACFGADAVLMAIQYGIASAREKDAQKKKDSLRMLYAMIIRACGFLISTFVPLAAGCAIAAAALAASWIMPALSGFSTDPARDRDFRQLRRSAVSFTVLTAGTLLLDYALFFQPEYLTADSILAFIGLAAMLIFYLTQMEDLAKDRHPKSGSFMLLFSHYLIAGSLALVSIPAVLDEGTLNGRYMVNFLYVGLALFVIGTLLNRRYASGERMLQPYVMGSFGGFLILGYMISQLFRENKFAVLLITMCIMLLLATEIVSFDMIADIHEKREKENNTPDMRM